jgi:magnesium-transporting ATPase (P-type)
MEKEIANFINIISVIAGVIGVVFFVISIINFPDKPVKAVVFMIGIIVANVPEGLLATVTVALTLTAQQMAERNVLVKDAKTIETLGSITTIASDKTGTLTQNRMTATHAIYSNKIVALDPVLKDKEEYFSVKDKDFNHLRRVASLCGTAVFLEQKEGEHFYDKNTKEWKVEVLNRKTEGDASESALLKFNEPLLEYWYNQTQTKDTEDGQDLECKQYTKYFRAKHKLIGAIPFNSTNKWMCTMHEPSYDEKNYSPGKESEHVQDIQQDPNDIIVMVKGAPERLMDMAKYVRISSSAQAPDQVAKQHPTDENLVAWDAVEKNRVGKLQMKLAAEGERVLGFGEVILKNGKDMLEKFGCEFNGGRWSIDAEDISSIDQGKLWIDDKDIGCTGLVFVGMISLVDPPRVEVPAAIQNCKTAGIQVVMVTGDHPVTAKAISERIGIITPGNTIEDWVRKMIAKDNIAALKKYMWDHQVDAEGKKIEDSAFQIHKDPKNPAAGSYSWHEITPKIAREVFENWKQAGRENEVSMLKVDGDSDEPLFYAPDGKDSALDLGDAGQTDHGQGDVRYLTAYKDPKAGWWRGFRFHDEIGSPHAEDPVQALVVAGPQLEEFTEADWRYALSREQLTFARTLPAQKQDIVRHMQNHHNSCAEVGIYTEKGGKKIQPKVVAVTGDGVNDSPALKKADCGVAMGTGSEVAQEAGNMILMDDDFASVVKGIEQGRLIFDNLKKSIAYTLTSNIPEITPFLFLILLAIPIPLETVMILCIDLGTDMLPAISLAYEHPESDIMQRPPRDQDTDRLVNMKLIGMCYGQIGVIQAAAGFCCYFCVFAYYDLLYEDIAGTGFDYQNDDKKFVCGLDYDTRTTYLRKAQTSFLMSIIVVQWADVMICKTRVLSIFQQGMWNTVLNIGLFEEVILGLCLCYVPFLQDAFKTMDIEFVMWCYGVPFSILIFVYDETRKMLLRMERDFYKQEAENRVKQAGGGQISPDIGFIESCTYY